MSTPDIMDIANQIERLLGEIRKSLPEINQRGDYKSQASAEYEKELAKKIIELRSGKEIEWEGKTFKDVPATLTEKIARGMLWREAMERDCAEVAYKAAIEGIKALETMLNGYQSLFRHLDNS